MVTSNIYARTLPAGMITTVHDAVANDSSKSYTVPTGKMWFLKHLQALLSCTAVVGDRHLEVKITDGANLIFQSEYITLQASQIGRIVMIPGMARATGISVWGDTSAKGNLFTLPDIVMRDGWVLTVGDLSAVDAAADDLTVDLQYLEVDY